MKLQGTVVEKPLVSVCVQTYRHAGYIEQCLNSILAQKTSFPYEIILGEDDSEDATREICKRFAEKYPDKIRLFLRSRKDVIFIDGKPTGRFNFMENLKASNGQYIAICEGDDYWTDTGKLQLQYDTLQKNPGYGICFHRVQEVNDFNPSQSKFLPDITSDTDYTIDDYILSNRTATCSMFFRRSLIDPLPAWFAAVPFGDLGTILLVMKRSNGKAIVLERVMAVYRVHGGGIHGSLKRDLSSLVRAYQQHIHFTRIIRDHFLTGPQHRKTILKKLESMHLHLTDVYRGNGNYVGVARATMNSYFYRMLQMFRAR